MCANILPYAFLKKKKKALGTLIFPLTMSAAFLLSSAGK